MEFSTILMIIGIICIVISFFLKDRSKKTEQDLEDLSISIYQETNSLKKRLRIIEEELLLEPSFTVKPKTPSKRQMEAYKQPNKQTNTGQNVQQINEILVSQVVQLNKQGYPVDEISKMSTLSKEQIISILNNGGRR